MAESNTIDVLENRVYLVLKLIADQQQKINVLTSKNEELEQNLLQKENQIQSLQRELESMKTQYDPATVEEYQIREEKLKNRLQELINQIDKVRLLE